MSLTDHFSISELSHSATAERMGIDNTPPESMTTPLFVLAVGLEQVRKLLGDHPLHIDSGYRCQALNAAIGGASNSAHMQGYAADFTCAEYGMPFEIAYAIVASDIQFDQLIQEGTWVHISFAPAMRRDVLTAHRTPRNTTTYTKGLT